MGNLPEDISKSTDITKINININFLIVEDRPELRGTYNYGGSADFRHVIYDVLPYWIWGNSEDDKTPFLRRVYPKASNITIGGIDIFSFLDY